MIHITPTLQIPESEITEQFTCAPGPGGQHVNKVSTAVQLRFDAANSPALSAAVKRRLFAVAGHLATADGVILIGASRHRSRERNREDAREKLAELIKKALTPPKPRKKTRPTKASRERRLDAKKKQGKTKKLRGKVHDS